MRLDWVETDHRQLYDQSPGLRYAPISMTQFAFAAGTIHLLCAANVTGRQQIAIEIQGVRHCISALQKMGDGFWCASQSGSILDGLLKEWCPEQDEGVQTISNKTWDEAIPVAQLLASNPNLADELKRLGWIPPIPTITDSADLNIQQEVDRDQIFIVSF